MIVARPRPSSPRHARRLLAVGVALTTAGLGITATPSLAAAAPLIPADAQNVTQVTVFLKAPHPAALAALSQARGLSRAQRLHALTALVPSAATHREVASELAARTLSVTHESAWSLTASGTASDIAAAFGTRPKLAGRTGAAAFRVATGTLPVLPSALSDDVSAVFPTTAGPAVMHRETTSVLSGADFRNADTPAGVTPSTGTNDAKTTVATVQFADFNSGGVSNSAASDTAADLTAYAKEHGLTDPVASGQYKAVHVDGGPSATDDTMGGDIEVDLDQEAILSTAPTADQHPYFAPNTDAGFGDIFSAVYDDVVGNSMATAPDANITALSSSWGECESGTGAAAINSVEPMLESLTAAGVTVFSASGDDGIYDCRSQDMTGLDNSQADVDFPGSSPVVVSVGGTNLSAAKSAPNTGTNWTETAWTCTDAVSCQSVATGTGGSGGGASGSAYSSTTSDSFAGFPAPAYQTDTLTAAPFAGAKTRLVPDIAADGDPETGFSVYTSNPQYVAEGGGKNDLQVGGTSLATPISAAQFDNALADAGRTTGVGDIHDALYSAYADTAALSTSNSAKVFRDVTSGSNGAAADQGSDPSVSAGTGYDTVTGLGGVLWSALVPYATSSGMPSATGTLALPNAFKTSDTYALHGTWASSPGASKSAVTGTKVTVTGSDGSTPYTTTSTDLSGTFGFSAEPGVTYTLTVTPTVLSGAKASFTLVRVVPIDDRSFTLSPGWTRKVNGGDFGGTHVNGAATSLTATVTGSGKTYALRVLTGPAHGKLAVYMGGKLVRTIDTWSANGGHKSKSIFVGSSDAVRTFVIKPLGTKAHRSTGVAVSLDDLVVHQ